MVKAPRSALLWLGLAWLAACAGAKKMEKAPDVSDEDFKRVTYPTYDESACSPAAPADWRGVAIRLPRRVQLPLDGPLTLQPEAAWLPICGLIRLTTRQIDALGIDPIKGTVLVFVDRATGAPVSFNLKPDKPEAPPDPTLPPDIEVLDRPPPARPGADPAWSQYFNVDGLMFHGDFPRRSARYHVHAMLGSYRSNTVEIEVEVR
jgi:hypothetical protein